MPNDVVYKYGLLRNEITINLSAERTPKAVSYTHLDVYKRQGSDSTLPMLYCEDNDILLLLVIYLLLLI